MQLSSSTLATLRKRLPSAVILAHRSLKARKFLKTYDQWTFFAEKPVDLRRMKLYRREYFPKGGPVPWLDRPDADQRIDKKLARGDLSEEQAEQCRFYSKNGYLILERFHHPDFLDNTWKAVERAVHSGGLPVTLEAMTEGDYEERFQDLHSRVPEVKEVLCHQPTLDVLKLLLGREIRPFQTLLFFKGSEQQDHSDSVHMTTYPEGYLAATWTAMEDVSPESGPLVYYPGSHKLPYYLSKDVGISPRESLLNHAAAYSQRYEPFIQELIKEEGLKGVVFTPKKGDMLIWHANLLHGGTQRKARGLSRKSVVCHYFARGAVSYHDLSGFLARPY